MGAQHKHIFEEFEGLSLTMRRMREQRNLRLKGAGGVLWGMGDDKVQEIIEGVSNACEHSFRRHIDEVNSAVGAAVGRAAEQAKNSTKEVKQALRELLLEISMDMWALGIKVNRVICLV